MFCLKIAATALGFHPRAPNGDVCVCVCVGVCTVHIGEPSRKTSKIFQAFDPFVAFPSHPLAEPDAAPSIPCAVLPGNAQIVSTSKHIMN